MTPLSAEEIARLRALLKVATDPAQRQYGTDNWWASFGRECAEVVPRLLAAQTDFIDAADAVRREYGERLVARNTMTSSERSEHRRAPVLALIAYDRERKNVTR